MSNKITWKFEGLDSTFTTPEEKFDVTVSQLRQRNYLSAKHPIQILNHGNTTTIESVANDLSTSNSTNNTKKRKSVSKSVESTESVEETPIVQPLSDNLDYPNPESDAI